MNNKNVTNIHLDFIFDEPQQAYFVAIEVNSSNMDNGESSSLKKGDIALIRYIRKDKFNSEFSESSMYVLIHENHIIFTLIQKYDRKIEKIYCTSLNDSPIYKDMTFHLDEIKSIYEVVQRVQTKI